ncbi:MAG: ABC transporter ATP-binding protein [Planctomycetota bacterium]
MVTSSTPVVEAVGLTKVFKDFWMRTKARAVDNLDLDIQHGEIFGLLGPNGSGKSTTIKMILGLLHKTSGRLLVFGRMPTDVASKKRIGFLPEESYLYKYLNARETLDYYGKIFGLDRRTRKRRTDELLDMIGLSQVGYRPIGEFSKGMMRRIGLAQALINDPDFLILDEPTSGLDPIGTRQVKDLIIEMGKRGKTILLSSHLLADVEDVCDRMVMLYGGRIRAEGSSDELLADTDRTVIETPRLRDETIARIEQVIEECEGQGIERVHAGRQRLEDLFVDIVNRARQEQVSTSGALHGGETAEFLRSEQAKGDDLIDALTNEQKAPPAARAVEATVKAPECDGPKQDEVLRDLIEPDAPKQAPRVVESGPAPETPKDVDSSFIDSLLDDDGPSAPGKN